MKKEIVEYIRSNWKNTVRNNTTDIKVSDAITRLGLPEPYTVPAADGMFQEMYYWDTYFIDLGLALSGEYEQILHNTNDIMYMVEKYGFMPNGNLNVFLSRSQPPFLSMMVRICYEHFHDKKWLAGAYKTLEKEYTFWQTKRMTSCGLNQYAGVLPDDVDGFAKEYRDRRGDAVANLSAEDACLDFMVYAESGWDITPRWEFEPRNYTQIGLNSLLWKLEDNMAFFAGELGKGADVQKAWTSRRDSRAEKIHQFCTNQDHVYYDYNFVRGTLSPVLSTSSWFPLFTGLATEEEAAAMQKETGRMEEAFGMPVCEKNDIAGNYQWNYPNLWPPMDWIVIKGLDNYGFTEDAHRLARKYCTMIENVFAENQHLWEKYNALEGNVHVSEEYKTPSMLGWTAGVYLSCCQLLGEL